MTMTTLIVVLVLVALGGMVLLAAFGALVAWAIGEAFEEDDYR